MYVSNFFAHMSQKLKSAFLIKIYQLSVVSIVVVGVNFRFLYQKHFINLIQTLLTAFLGKEGLCLCNEGLRFQHSIYWDLT